MQKWKIVSKTFGTHYVFVDDKDFERLKELGGKWCLAKKRGRYYPQKRLSGNNLIEMHRWIMQPKNGEYVDHISGDTLDNRRSNLRICTNAANLRNARIRTDNKSGYKGVHLVKRTGKYVAYIKVNYKRIHLGSFDKMQDAIKIRAKAEQQYWNT